MHGCCSPSGVTYPPPRWAVVEDGKQKEQKKTNFLGSTFLENTPKRPTTMQQPGQDRQRQPRSHAGEPEALSSHSAAAASSPPFMAKSGKSRSHFVMGGAAGLLSAALLQPLDVVRTRLQGEKPVSFTASVESVVQKDGVKGLWLRGIVPTLLRATIGPGIYFQIISSSRKPDSYWNYFGQLNEFWRGAVARGIGSVAVAPLTLIKARQEWGHADSAPKSIRGAFVGLAPTLARDIPFSGLHLWFYTSMKPIDGSRVTNLVAGFGAGCLATLFTMPFDVIRTRRQIGGPPISHVNELFSGFTLRLVKRPLTTAVAWFFFEELDKN